MSDTVAERERFLAEIRHMNEESAKFVAEQHKLIAEQAKLAAEQAKFSVEQVKLAAEQIKLAAEARKLDRDRGLTPWLAVVGLVGGVVAAATLILHAVGRL